MTGIVILNYNNILDTINCIESVERYNTSPIKYIVVDNGSSKKGVAEELHDYFLKKFSKSYCRYDYEKGEKPPKLSYLSYVVSKTNDGYARGNNKGLEYAYADKDISDVMILNNDILFVEDIIPALISARSNMNDVAIISPVLYKKDLAGIDYNCARLCHTNWEIILTFLLLYKDIFHIISKATQRRYLLKREDSLKKKCLEVELPSGSCMLIRKELMKEFGGFDPNTFLYYEENILYKKISKLKLKNYTLSTCKCIHIGASSTKKASSYFVLKSGINSVSYYLNNYANMSLLQTIIWNIAYGLFHIKLFFIKIIKG